MNEANTGNWKETEAWEYPLNAWTQLCLKFKQPPDNLIALICLFWLKPV